MYQAANYERVPYPRVLQPSAELACFDWELVGRGGLNLLQLAEWEVAEGNCGTDSICHSKSPSFIA